MATVSKAQQQDDDKETAQGLFMILFEIKRTNERWNKILGGCYWIGTESPTWSVRGIVFGSGIRYRHSCIVGRKFTHVIRKASKQTRAQRHKFNLYKRTIIRIRGEQIILERNEKAKPLPIFECWTGRSCRPRYSGGLWRCHEELGLTIVGERYPGTGLWKFSIYTLPLFLKNRRTGLEYLQKF